MHIVYHAPIVNVFFSCIGGGIATYLAKRHFLFKRCHTVLVHLLLQDSAENKSIFKLS